MGTSCSCVTCKSCKDMVEAVDEVSRRHTLNSRRRSQQNSARILLSTVTGDGSSVRGGFWAWYMGQNHSVSNSNRLHVVIFRLLFNILRFTPHIYIPSNDRLFPWSLEPHPVFFKLNRSICNKQSNLSAYGPSSKILLICAPFWSEPPFDVSRFDLRTNFEVSILCLQVIHEKGHSLHLIKDSHPQWACFCGDSQPGIEHQWNPHPAPSGV